MLAPRPTKKLVTLVLFVCLTESSLPSAVMVVVTVKLPFTAVQEPIATLAEAPGFSVPLKVPFSVATVPPDEFRMTEVIGWAPLMVAMLPWFRRFTVKATALPPLGLLGLQVVVPTRSELAT